MTKKADKKASKKSSKPKTEFYLPGELLPEAGEIELNAGRATVTLTVANTGDRPIQVGSHFHFFEVNKALEFDRDRSHGMRLDIPAGTAVRFEPGDERDVTLVALAGSRQVFGLNGLINGALDHSKPPEAAAPTEQIEQTAQTAKTAKTSSKRTKKSTGKK